MTTLGAMEDRIAYEVRTISTASSSGIQSQIRAAIQSSIRKYEREGFYFNEKRSTLSTSDGAEYYTTSDYPFIDKIAEIESVRITVNGSHYTLQERDWAFMDEIQSSNSEGDPTDFAYYGQQIRFYPIPNAVRTVIVSHIEKAASLSASTDTNYWMTEAEELIRSCAKADLYENLLKDYESADRMRLRTAEAYNDLRAETAARVMTGKARPTYF